MRDPKIRRAALDELRAMKDRGEVSAPRDDRSEPDAAEAAEGLAGNLRDDDVLGGPRARSVRLRPGANVFEHVVAGTGGERHLTRMRAVLRAKAKRARRGS